MAYLLCRYKEEKFAICAIFQIYMNPEHEIALCRINKEDFVPLDKEYGLIHLVNVGNDDYRDRIRVEIYNLERKHNYIYYVPRDNVQMTSPVKK